MIERQAHAERDFSSVLYAGMMTLTVGLLMRMCGWDLAGAGCAIRWNYGSAFGKLPL